MPDELQVTPFGHNVQQWPSLHSEGFQKYLRSQELQYRFPVPSVVVGELQVSQLVDVVFGATSPTGQAKHLAIPVLCVTRPAGHFLQAD